MTIQDLEHEVTLHELFVERALKLVEVAPGRALMTEKEQHLEALEYGRIQGWLWSEFFSEDPTGKSSSPRWGWRYRLTDAGIARLFHRK